MIAAINTCKELKKECGFVGGAPGADRYELIDYDRALQLAGRKMRATRPDRSFFYGR